MLSINASESVTPNGRLSMLNIVKTEHFGLPAIFDLLNPPGEVKGVN